ncbi:ABC transporter ATP-binding protein [Brevundimonas sp. 2R-24]|uniref:ABC transporter ATP-binding protein n=1 Tax=Peiella sedimenti TaxID=3061083 RepID=A0ABT8SKD6_9CAUL|nr:ABC transporter ATP-binding protein [Caulobacteraceae bacterium XZ-24]
MSAPVIEAEHLRLHYPVLSMRARSLRNAVLNRAVGGRLLKAKHETVTVLALDGISFTLEEGDRLAIIGPNGSGKSTLLKVLAGIYEPDTGRVSVRGKVSSFLDLSFGLEHEATGRENVKTMLRLKGLKKDEIEARIPEIVAFSGLENYFELPVRTYSSGMFARLLFSTATAIDTDVLVMDEWLSAGDAEFVERATARMNAMFSSARVAVLATHNPKLVDTVCNKVLVLEKGKPLYFGLVKDSPGNF